MITVTSEAASVLAGSGFIYRVAVESWLNGVLLAASVPIATGGEETDSTLNVPERVTLTVPRVKDGVDWTPTSDSSPLAAKGQRLHVKLGIGLSLGRFEWITRARLLIEESEVDGDVVAVSAVGLLQLIQEARLIAPFQPSGTIVSTVRALVEPALTVLVDSGLADRSVPSGITYDEDRLRAAQEVIDAWPAVATVDPEGYLRVGPNVQSTTAVLALTDTGTSRTVIEATGRSTREGAANVIVARGTASDGSQVQAVSYVTSGPDAVGGPYNPLPVPYFFQSPLLTTVGQCQLAADTIRDRRQRRVATEYQVTMVPHPALQIGDVVSLTSARLSLSAVLCTIQRLVLPYTAGTGQLSPMVLVVKTL